MGNTALLPSPDALLFFIYLFAFIYQGASDWIHRTTTELEDINLPFAA